MNIQRAGIERAHRTGKPKHDGPRTVAAKFSSYKIKQLVVNNVSSLKIIDYFINEDYSKDTAQERKMIRKEKWKKVKELQEQGKYAPCLQ